MFRAQSVATALLNDPGDRNSGPPAVERGATGARARGARLAACEMRVAGGDALWLRISGPAAATSR